MIHLPNVTLIIADTRNYGQAYNAIQKTLREITPAKTLFFTNMKAEFTGVEIVQIQTMYNKSAYSKWMIKELGNQDIQTSHILVIQHDGFVLDGAVWDDEYLEYDYVGAPWLEQDGANVGNGGFSLRSMKLQKILAEDSFIKGLHPEDNYICRVYRDYLEQTYQIKFAPDHVAHRFSYELHEPKDKTFGFHANFHRPYVEPIVIKRQGAMGDVIALEPVLSYFHEKGHPVYLDTQPGFLQMFVNHYFPVGDYSRFDKDVIKHRVINLDMAYEIQPNQSHLKSYAQAAGIDEPLRAPQLRYKVTPQTRLFPEKYIVLHIDTRETEHRNPHGINWARIVTHLEDAGYLVIQIGHGPHPKVAIEYNTVNEVFLMWLLGGATFFIGIDSGPANIAVALRIPSIIFFGSVNPDHIHPDLSRVLVMQSKCPIGKQHCWSAQISTRGIDCEVDSAVPPCTEHTTQSVMEAINRMI